LISCCFTSGSLAIRTASNESIPGVSKVSALAILSEIGADMSRFETAGNLISWARLSPESGGKHKRTRLCKGAPG
jgi:transposase